MSARTSLTFEWAGILLAGTLLTSSAKAQQPMSREVALRAAIHPVSTLPEARAWLARVPVTRLSARLRGRAARAGITLRDRDEHGIGCIACADLWESCSRYERTMAGRFGRLALRRPCCAPGDLGFWVGNPVAWVRPIADPNRMVPVAIGTDHSVNLARNTYLAAKMLTGVRVAVGVRAMSKFTGIVSPGR
jgi:hypothetical protein